MNHEYYMCELELTKSKIVALTKYKENLEQELINITEELRKKEGEMNEM